MTVTESNTTTKDGKVVSIAGPVIDVEFPEDSLPEINSALSSLNDTIQGTTLSSLYAEATLNSAVSAGQTLPKS